MLCPERPSNTLYLFYYESIINSFDGNSFSYDKWLSVSSSLKLLYIYIANNPATFFNRIFIIIYHF